MLGNVIFFLIHYAIFKVVSRVEHEAISVLRNVGDKKISKIGEKICNSRMLVFIKSFIYIICCSVLSLYSYVSVKQSFPRNVQALMKDENSCPINILSCSVRLIKLLKKFISFAIAAGWTP